MTKPEILLVGPYPEWDLVELERDYTVHKFYEAQDKEKFLPTTVPVSAPWQHAANSVRRPR
ncbi:hypothetical protein J2X71_001744 [Rhizobium sp. 1399]|nr:hypothetical protein [Rhizobium sp. 1399]